MGSHPISIAALLNGNLAVAFENLISIFNPHTWEEITVFRNTEWRQINSIKTLANGYLAIWDSETNLLSIVNPDNCVAKFRNIGIHGYASIVALDDGNLQLIDCMTRMCIFIEFAKIVQK